MAEKKQKTRGLILREMTLGESDRLVTVLTEDQGVIRAFARRAKNLSDGKNAATSLLCYSRLDLYRGRERYIINSAIPIETFFGLRSDIVALALAQYLCQFTEELVPEGPDSGEYLRLVLNTLHFLSEGSRPPELLKALIELRMLSMSGFMPAGPMSRSVCSSGSPGGSSTVKSATFRRTPPPWACRPQPLPLCGTSSIRPWKRPLPSPLKARPFGSSRRPPRPIP